MVTVIISKRDWKHLKAGYLKNLQLFNESELHHMFGDSPEDEIVRVRITKAPVAILVELDKRIKELNENYAKYQKKIGDAVYSDDDFDKILDEVVKKYPAFEFLWVREQLWTRRRGLEEAKQMIENEENTA